MTSKKGLLALLLLLGGCAGLPPAAGSAAGDDPRAPLVAPDARIALPRPADLGRSVEVAQLITVRREGQTFAFEGHMSVTPEAFTLVGLDGMGRRTMTLTWTDAGIQSESAPWLPDAVRPGSMLADIVLLYWPDAAVRKALAPVGGTLASDDHTRSIRVGGRDLMEAKHSWSSGGPWTGTLHYTNRAWGYEIDVQSVETPR
ncbi:DUF3261 domain-containing protein [Azospirillum doebereinerae]|uniref:DUF3261 domain-containing protein n=1 Tax=Azospirillum doebereinerae TaxID=92933 RepID=A0A3S0WPY3_9PROT|nr:DUF3261 domain-containing protein [Azospirillum doebereinerae]RUQ75890.1 DUF3261 domain-containing protein [Azospirillum doebereinerae]